jgi:colicin import membrane protein
MAEQKESSVLFSLKELMNLEEDRIKQEADEKKRRAESEAQSRLDVERRAREQEQQRVLAEEDRRRNEDLRKREEATRLDAIRHAEIEKARVEAENRARMEAMTKQQEHERQLTALTQDKHKKKLQRNLMLTGGGAVLVIALGVGWFFGVKKPADEKREAEMVAAQVAHDEEVKRLTKALEDQQAKVGSLLQDLASAKDENTRSELRAKLAEAQKQQQGLVQRAAGGGPRPSSGGDKPKPPCNCQPGDPLCSCL